MKFVHDLSIGLFSLRPKKKKRTDTISFKREILYIINFPFDMQKKKTILYYFVSQYLGKKGKLRMLDDPFYEKKRDKTGVRVSTDHKRSVVRTWERSPFPGVTRNGCKKGTRQAGYMLQVSSLPA